MADSKNSSLGSKDIQELSDRIEKLMEEKSEKLLKDAISHIEGRFDKLESSNADMKKGIKDIEEKIDDTQKKMGDIQKEIERRLGRLERGYGEIRRNYNYITGVSGVMGDDHYSGVSRGQKRGTSTFFCRKMVDD
jgi:chromosome segregation ATPase